MSKILKTRGKVGLIEWCKNHRLALLHYLSGESKTKRVAGVLLDKDDFPKRLGLGVKERIKEDTLLLRLLLTLLFSTRALRVGKKCSTKSITQLPLNSELECYNKYCTDFWRALGYRPSKTRVPTRIKWRGFHFTTKAGPSKGQALYNSMVDLLLVRADNQLISSIWTLGGSELKRRMKILFSILSILPKTFYPKTGTTLRRITWFPAQEVKTRVVAILDYWSQTALLPFHNYLFQVLRKIPQDCTFDQGSFTEKVKDWQEYYSVDLTAATDRFPIKVISFVLRGLLPDHFVNAWEYVMTGLPFDFQQDKLTYNAGQPMGAYSSWNSFAVAHHYIMYWCCRELGIDWKTSKYVMLGDDVLIGDRLLALKYKEVMAHLGVEISAMKTHESKQLFEFAKRLFLNGREISPFPISAIVESSRRVYLLTNLLMAEKTRSWDWPTGVPRAIEEFYSYVLKQNRTQAVRARDRALSSEQGTLVLRGTVSAYSALSSLAGQRSVLLPPLPSRDAESIFSKVAMDVFVEKGSLDWRSGRPLGYLAQELTIILTGLELSSVVGAAVHDVPSSFPLLNCYGQTSEKYMEVMDQISNIYKPGSQGWPMTLRSLTIPVSDEVFVERSTNTVARVGAVFGEKVLNHLIATYGINNLSRIHPSIAL